MTRASPIVQVAIPAPLRRRFDYLSTVAPEILKNGIRIRVPFGRREVVGVVVGVAEDTVVERTKLRPISEVLDREPILSASLLSLLLWAAEYYHHPIGEVMQTALPVLLRRGHPPIAAGIETWVVTEAGCSVDPGALARAPVQQKLLRALVAQPEGVNASALRELSQGWRNAIHVLQAKGWVANRKRDCLQSTPASPKPGPSLNPAQRRATGAITRDLDGFHPFLLHGVTGSGKTEVYLCIIREVLARERQVLVLVPEIGLTPQLVGRFQRRFGVPIAVLHSGLTDQERLCAWLMARAGKAPIVLGTRSAVFTPLRHPGLIIVDEEHDGSFKQQDGFRYHARDVALMRASRENIPIVLGSATPSLESLHNARQQRCRYLELPTRTGNATMPEVYLLDMRRLPVEEGLSRPLLQALRDRLERGEQSLLFLNRRGFAPVLMCCGCGWVAPCPRCDAKLTVHKRSHRLRCHHCGGDRRYPDHCPECGSKDLHDIGEGTERVEAALARRLPEARIVRIDRDTTRRKDALADKLQHIRKGEADILVGTQMLSKGHHFPNVTLVGVLNADQGLYGADFRAGEYLFRQIIQVAGRAGRGDKPGLVLIQTRHPDNPYFTALATHDYHAFAEFALQERRQAGLPPYTYLALLRAESPHAGAAMKFLETARREAAALLSGPLTGAGSVRLMEPVPSPMERRAGRYRAQLLVQSTQRSALHGFIRGWLDRLDSLRVGRSVRSSIDIDPMDMH